MTDGDFGSNSYIIWFEYCRFSRDRSRDDYICDHDHDDYYVASLHQIIQLPYRDYNYYYTFKIMFHIVIMQQQHTCSYLLFYHDVLSK